MQDSFSSNYLEWRWFIISTERDLIELKQSYETRIERMRNEAETTVTNAVTEAEKVIASVKNLYENQVR